MNLGRKLLLAPLLTGLVALAAGSFSAWRGDHDATQTRAVVKHGADLVQTMASTRDQVGGLHIGVYRTIGLIGSEAFFAPNLANLSSQAIQVLDTIAPILAAQPNEVKIEGHADRHGVTINYPTDWELSSGRATAVLRRLVEHGGIAQERISAVGYGSARPVATGSDLAAMAQNRRVDTVMLSTQPEAVRALIPSVLDGTAVSPHPAEPAETTTKVATTKKSTTTEKAPAKAEEAPAKSGH